MRPINATKWSDSHKRAVLQRAAAWAQSAASIGQINLLAQSVRSIGQKIFDSGNHPDFFDLRAACIAVFDAHHTLIGAADTA